MNRRLYAIRGAVCCENTKESITENVQKMMRELFDSNGICSENHDGIVSLVFSMTPDLDEKNAAKAFREGDYGFDVSGICLWTSQEANIKGMLPRTVRAMLTVYLPENTCVNRVYMNGAEALRPDIKKQIGCSL